MLLQNLLLYGDKYYIRVNEENDTVFYFFDYDVRSADINMVFQHFHTFFELCIPLCPNAVHFIEGIPYEVTSSTSWASPPTGSTRPSIPPDGPAGGSSSSSPDGWPVQRARTASRRL